MKKRKAKPKKKPAKRMTAGETDLLFYMMEQNIARVERENADLRRRNGW